MTLYFPQTNTWEERKTPGGPMKPGHYSSMAYDPVSKQLIYPRAVPTGRKAERLEAGMSLSHWRPSEKGYREYEFQTWSYDPDTNVWTSRKPPSTPKPAYRHRFGLTYDSQNQLSYLSAAAATPGISRSKT